MYVKRTWRCGKCIEVEKYQTFRYKGKMTVRAPQSNPTPEAMAKVNERNSYKNLRRLLNTNFGKGDLHCVLTYAPDKEQAASRRQKRYSEILPQRETEMQASRLKFQICGCS